jgi:hypothetical protein
MNLAVVAKIAGGVLLAGVLAGCVSAAVDVVVLDEGTARGTMKLIVPAATYAELRSEGDAQSICKDSDEVAEVDGGLVCTTVQEGAFADLSFAGEQGDGGVTFKALGNGLVRVAFPLAEMADSDTPSEEELQMISALFADQTVTMSVSGGIIVETNMELAPDGLSATMSLPLANVFAGGLGGMGEAFAVVEVNS